MSNQVQDGDKINRLQSALGDTYTICNRIGGGGMGDVYLATHKTLGDKRAIKLLPDDLAKDPILVERFINEAKIEANLQHPNIVKVFDIGQKEHFYYLVMSFVEGEDLDERLRRNKKANVRMDVREAVSIGLQVLRALECAHDSGIVHRDLKPSNIRIDLYGTIIVMDFGIARVRQAGLEGKTILGERLGTPSYMSPEQAAGRPVDTRSDLYSLGVILYEMLASGKPFEAEDPLAICMKHLQYEPPQLVDVRPDVPEDISLIVKKLLQKNPDDRYQYAAQVLQDLSAVGMGADVRTPRPTVSALGGDEGEIFEPARLSGRNTTSRSASPLIPTVTPPPRIKTAVPQPTVRLQKTTPRKNVLMWAAVTAVVVIAAIFGATIAFRTPLKLSEVKVDAAPFATVTILSEKGDKILTDDTPFTVSLAPGSYTFDFVSADQAPRRITKKVGPQSSDTVRLEFWDSSETKKLLESYIQ